MTRQLIKTYSNCRLIMKYRDREEKEEEGMEGLVSRIPLCENEEGKEREGEGRD